MRTLQAEPPSSSEGEEEEEEPVWGQGDSSDEDVSAQKVARDDAEIEHVPEMEMESWLPAPAAAADRAPSSPTPPTQTQPEARGASDLLHDPPTTDTVAQQLPGQGHLPELSSSPSDSPLSPVQSGRRRLGFAGEQEPSTKGESSFPSTRVGEKEPPSRLAISGIASAQQLAGATHAHASFFG